MVRSSGGHVFPIAPSDADLREINELLDWHAGAPLPDGRILGRVERTPSKRAAPGVIPDARIRLLNKLIPLKNKKVLEIGCFEGIHTAGLKGFECELTAIDVRPQNVIKTLTRLSWHGMSAEVFQYDAEAIGPDFPKFDIVFHIGVLYHMMHPVQHLKNLAHIGELLFLDTHVATEGSNVRSFEIGDKTYRGQDYAEGGWKNPFSGKDPSALWLTEDSLMDALGHAGFAQTRLLQRRDERNGLRLLVLAARTDLPKDPAIKAKKKAQEKAGA